MILLKLILTRLHLFRFQHALLVIDYWTGKIACRAIKSDEEIEKKLDSIFKKDFGVFPTVLKADEGKFPANMEGVTLTKH